MFVYSCVTSTHSPESTLTISMQFTPFVTVLLSLTFKCQNHTVIAAGLGINSIGFSLSLYVIFLCNFYVYLLDVIQCSSVTVQSATKRRYLAGLDVIAIWLGWIILDYSLDGLDIFYWHQPVNIWQWFFFSSHGEGGVSF